MTRADSDLDVVLPRQRPPSEPHSIAERRRRARRADDIAKLVVWVLALLAFVGITGLALADLVLGLTR